MPQPMKSDSGQRARGPTREAGGAGASGRRALRTLEPAVLRWARERAGLGPETLAGRMNVKPERVRDWERSGEISVSQADRLALRTHTPLGFLYLREPPDDDLPIPDFRALTGRPRRPSPDLLDTVHLMARRQTWMREELIEDGAEPLPFVGCCGKGSTPAQAASAMREHLRLSSDWAARQPSWTEALRHLRERAEASGVLVVFNGVVGNNTRRKLNRNEFQGFALVDGYAPLVFVNGADFKAAQMFTLAHELAHVLTGQTGVSNLDTPEAPDQDTEQFCNRSAAEFLVPEQELRAHWHRQGTLDAALQQVAKRFKVSVLVASRRALDLRLIARDEFRRAFDAYQEQAAVRPDETTGGNFWNSQNVRIGLRFGAAVSRAVGEGRLSYREAYALTGLRGDTFDTFVRSLEQTP